MVTVPPVSRPSLAAAAREGRCNDQRTAAPHALAAVARKARRLGWRALEVPVVVVDSNCPCGLLFMILPFLSSRLPQTRNA